MDLVPDFSKIVDEVKTLLKRGARVMVVSAPGSGKTTRLLPQMVQQLGRPLIVSLPYYETIEVLKRALPPSVNYFVVKGGGQLCAFNDYWTGRCKFCDAPWADWPPYNVYELHRVDGKCAYKVQRELIRVRKFNVLLKTHSMRVQKDERLFISDEVHIHLDGRIAVTSVNLKKLKQTPYETLLLRWLKERDPEERKRLAEQLQLLYQLTNGEAEVADEEENILHIRYPQRDEIDIGLTGTPPLKYSGFETIYAVKSKIKVYIVYGPDERLVNTTSKEFDPALVLRFVEAVKRDLEERGADGRIALFLTMQRRQAMGGIPDYVDVYYVWGDNAVGVTLSHSALILTSPYLPPAAYRRVREAESITVAQVVQIAYRLRGRGDVYILSDVVKRYANYFSEHFDIDYVTFDGEVIRRR
jgi:hypothetical protein